MNSCVKSVGAGVGAVIAGETGKREGELEHGNGKRKEEG